MTKPGFTLEEHREFGTRFGLIIEELTHMYVKLASAYPNTTASDLDIALKRLEDMRSKLDDIVCRDNPELEDQDVVNIYYGSLSGKRPQR
jgi:hypothetical protein